MISDIWVIDSLLYKAVFSVITQRSFPQDERFRDDSKNGCVVAD